MWQADEILQICSPKIQFAVDFLLSNRSNKRVTASLPSTNF